MKLKHNKIYQAFILLFFITSIPIWLWLRVQTITAGNVGSLVAGIGELAGIVGTVLFSLTLALSARPTFLEKIFGGLNKLYDYHSKIGQIAFVLLLIHPLLLLSRYATNIQSAAEFFSLSGNWQQNFGIISLYLSIVVIVMTLYLRPKYHIWKFIHKFLGLALFIGALHIYLSPSYVLNSSFALRVYVLGWAIFGISIWLYRSVLGKKFTKVYEYIVSKSIDLNKNITEIELSPKNPSKKVDFTPGQFVFVSFRNEKISKEEHPFSITSLPEDENITLAIKTLGNYTNILKDRIEVWDKVYIEEAFGTFSYSNYKREKQIWIAGGIGVTPFISMAKDLLHNKHYNIHMYYAVRNESEAVYLNVLQNIENNVENFSVEPFFSDEHGFITAEYISSNTHDVYERDILICAPQTMIQSLKNGFRKFNISNNHLFSEEFNF